MRPGEPGSRQRVDSNSRPLPSWLPTRLLLGQARAGRAGTSPWGVSGLGGRGTATVPEGFRARKPRHAIVLVELRDSVARAWSIIPGGGEGGVWAQQPGSSFSLWDSGTRPPRMWGLLQGSGETKAKPRAGGSWQETAA